MNKEKWIHKLKEKFNLPNDSKFCFYRNPKDFIYFNLERVNPEHRIIIWGKPKRKIVKHKNIKSLLRVGRIKIPILLFFNRVGDYYIYLFERFILRQDFIETSINLFFASVLFLFFFQLCFNGVFIYHIRIH